MSYIEKAARRRKEEIGVGPFKLQSHKSQLSTIRCSTWNVTSMVNKTPDIMEHIIDRDPSIVFLQETWLKTNRSNVTALVKDYGYVLIHNTRKNREKEGGGGVGLLLKHDINYKHVKHKEFSSFG